MEELQEEHKNLEKKKKELEQNLEALEQQRKEKKSNLRRLEKLLSDEIIRTNRYSIYVKTTQKQMEKVDNQLNELKNELTKLKMESETLEKIEEETITTEQKTKLAELTNQIKEKEKEEKNLTERREELRKEISELFQETTKKAQSRISISKKMIEVTSALKTIEDDIKEIQESKMPKLLKKMEGLAQKLEQLSVLFKAKPSPDPKQSAIAATLREIRIRWQTRDDFQFNDIGDLDDLLEYRKAMEDMWEVMDAYIALVQRKKKEEGIKSQISQGSLFVPLAGNADNMQKAMVDSFHVLGEVIPSKEIKQLAILEEERQKVIQIHDDPTEIEEKQKKIINSNDSIKAFTYSGQFLYHLLEIKSEQKKDIASIIGTKELLAAKPPISIVIRGKGLSQDTIEEIENKKEIEIKYPSNWRELLKSPPVNTLFSSLPEKGIITVNTTLGNKLFNTTIPFNLKWFQEKSAGYIILPLGNKQKHQEHKDALLEFLLILYFSKNVDSSYELYGGHTIVKSNISILKLLKVQEEEEEEEKEEEELKRKGKKEEEEEEEEEEELKRKEKKEEEEIKEKFKMQEVFSIEI